MMIKVSLVVYMITLCIMGYYADFKQGGAKLILCNPKYIKDCSCMTGRRSRRDPYKTNMTGTLLMPFADNVTIAITLQMKSGGDFRVAMKLCDTIKAKWLLEFINYYSNVPMERCPYPAVMYKYTNMELPPKNMPVPLIDGDYVVKFELYITATKEPICEANVFLHYDKNMNIRNKKNRQKP